MEVMVGGISAMSPYVHTSYRYMGYGYMAFRPMRKSERLWRQDALQAREHLWSRSALCRQWKPMLRGESGI